METSLPASVCLSKGTNTLDELQMDFRVGGFGRCGQASEGFLDVARLKGRTITVSGPNRHGPKTWGHNSARSRTKA